MNLGKGIWVFFVLFLFLLLFYKFTLLPNKKFKKFLKNILLDEALLKNSVNSFYQFILWF